VTAYENFEYVLKGSFTPSVKSIHVFLPTELVICTAHIVGLAQSHVAYGDKLQNSEAQLVHAVRGICKKGDYAYALRTLGKYAVITESQHAPIQRNLPTRCAIGMKGTGCPGLFNFLEEYVLTIDPKFRAWRHGPSLDDEEIVFDPTSFDDPEVGLEEAKDADQLDSAVICTGSAPDVQETSVEPIVVEVPSCDVTSDALAPSAGVGARQAYKRMPDTTDGMPCLFANNSETLQASFSTRYDACKARGVGQDSRSPALKRKYTLIADALKKYVYNKDRVVSNDNKVCRDSDALPVKYGNEENMRLMDQILFEDKPQAVQAHVKAEVTAKPKPRSIAAHGNTRLCVVARLFAVHGKCLFSALRGWSIKYRAKAEVMREISMVNHEMSQYKRLYNIENDLTGFEWGIHKGLKKFENDILAHILKIMGYNPEVPADLIEQNLRERADDCKWMMRTKDESGEKVKLRMDLGICMRESGDRGTSELNYLQNFAAWLAFFVDDTDIDNVIKNLVKTSATQPCSYISARDGMCHQVRCNFEGDDADITMTEPIDDKCLEDHFKYLGWIPKIVRNDGPGYGVTTYVGYHRLTYDAKPVFDCNMVVMCPEIKRFIRDKAWSTAVLTDSERAMVESLNFHRLAEGYRNIDGMREFCNALAKGWQARVDGRFVTLSHGVRDAVRQMALADTGEMLTNSQMSEYIAPRQGVPTPASPTYTTNAPWNVLRRLAAGDISLEEESVLCGLIELDPGMPIRDARLIVPQTWRT
jgi:hypothetical protein